MKQVTQTLRTGVVEVNDVPTPALNHKFILVKNTASFHYEKYYTSSAHENALLDVINKIIG